MTLSGGTRLGPYEIIAPAGAGGMGQVYRARDTRLGRDVAVKIIESEQEPTAEQRQRFDREARAVAQLTHPNICALHDVGREAGRDFIVMELLQGETLAARLSRGPLPMDQCLSIGANIAAALAAAHDRGIVHRDLKPANVMLTASGPKLLDFGIAKAFGGNSVIADRAATDAARLTGTGIVVGTVPYMAPEQIEGKPADARTDIFALGAVLYEMATGQAAFSAPNPVALVGVVLSGDPPPITASRPDATRSLDRLIRQCLAKDPAERWHSAHDIELQFRAMAAEVKELPERLPDAGSRSLTRWLPWVLTAGALAVVGVMIARSMLTPPAASSTVRFTIEPPAGGGFTSSIETNGLAVSPDGLQVAFIAFDHTGEQRVWLRPLAASSATPVAATLGAQSVMWSPDGKAIAFFTSDRLQRIDLPDGAPVTITAIQSATGQSGTWGRRGDILFAGVQGEAIYRVPASGGTPEVVLRLDTGAGDARIHWPWYLPDGERFLYKVKRADGEHHLMQFSPGAPPVLVAKIESFAQYAEPGYLAFVRDGTLLGQSFDWQQGKVSGAPFAFADVRYFFSTGSAAAATSPGGTLAFQTGHDLQRLAWLDRTGRESGSVSSTGGFQALTISPDARRLLLQRQRLDLGTWDIWIVDLERNTETALTTARTGEVFGIWVPGGRSVVYSVVTAGPPNLVRRDLGSSTETPLLPSSSDFQSADDISPDGRLLLYSRRPGVGSFDVWSLSLDGERRPSPVLETPFDERDARFSPDGRFVSFISTETGRSELYVMPFPGPAEKIRVSSDGAVFARWPRGAGELVYLARDGKLVSVKVSTEPSLTIGKPVTLFTLDAGTIWTTFDVTPDGQRFIAAIPVAEASRQPVTVITNWPSIAPR